MKSEITPWSWLVVGTCLGFAVCLSLSSLFASKLSEGYFVRWKLLGHPEHKIARIVSADSGDVFVESTTGTLYRGWVRYCENPQQQCWEEIDRAYHNSNLQLGIQCDAGFPGMQKPPGQIFQCASTKDYHNDLGYFYESHFALLKDGNVWLWEHFTGQSTSATRAATFVSVIFVFIGMLFGMFGAAKLYKYVIFKQRSDKLAQDL